MRRITSVIFPGRADRPPGRLADGAEPQFSTIPAATSLIRSTRAEHVPVGTSKSPGAAPKEAAALPDPLPVVLVEYALSKLKYFASVAGTRSSAHLAYDRYLLGHAD
jgi:hypothetical protein